MKLEAIKPSVMITERTTGQRRALHNGGNSSWFEGERVYTVHLITDES